MAIFTYEREPNALEELFLFETIVSKGFEEGHNVVYLSIRQMEGAASDRSWLIDVVDKLVGCLIILHHFAQCL